MLMSVKTFPTPSPQPLPPISALVKADMLGPGDEVERKVVSSVPGTGLNGPEEKCFLETKFKIEIIM